MIEANTDLRLFGYDLRSAGSFFRSGITQLFWDYDSLVRQRLDEPVLATVLASDDGVPASTLWFRGSQQLQGDVQIDSPCTATVLPDDVVLHRTLRLPGALSSNIEEAVQLDVKAFSPFPHDDTAFGWRVAESDSETICLDVAIVSRAAVAKALRQFSSAEFQGEARSEAGSRGTTAPEVWSFTPDSQKPVVILGFGEAHRDAQYASYLSKFLAAVGVAVLALALAPLLSGIVLSLRADSLDDEMAALRASTADELRMREELLAARELGESIAEEVREQANFARELAVISERIPDDAFANRVELVGRELRVSGLARDAASLMTRLSEHPGYAQVVNKGGFRRDRSGKERYSFEITLGDPDSGVDP